MSLAKNPTVNDEDLPDQLTKGGITRRRAEDELFQRYMYLMRESEKKFSLTGDEVFDAYSDTVLSVIDAVQRQAFERRSSLKTYFIQIFHNKCVDLVRKKSTNKYSVHNTTPITDMLHSFSDPAKLIVQRLIDKTDVDLLKQKLKQLSESCRQLLLLSAEGHSDRELAAILEYKSSDVVKTSRLRCMEKLRQLYSVK